MFERLFRKKNIFSYIPAILAAFSSMVMGINPFSSAIFVVMVEEKVPVLITFLITSIVQLLLFGYVNTLKFLIFVIVYSIIKAFSKNTTKYDSNDIVQLAKNFLPKILIASVISEGILLITRVEELSDFPEIICYVISIALFSIVFRYAYKYYYSLLKESDEKVKYIHIISFVILFTICISFVKGINIFGVNLWIVLSIVLLMIVAWKKNIVFGILSSLLVSLVILLCTNVAIGIIILMLVVGIVTTLISKAGRKGALIGLVFSFVILLITFGRNAVNNNPAMNERMQEDYYSFLKSSLNSLSGDEYEKTSEEIARIEEMDRIQKEAQNTLSSTIIKCMLIGFFLLCVIPIKYLDYINGLVPDAPDIEDIRTRLFRVSKIYRLNPGKEENEDKKEEWYLYHSSSFLNAC